MSAATLLTLGVLAAAAKAPPLMISPEELSKQAAKTMILDARDPTLYEEGHIPNAVSLPWVELAQMPKSPVSKEPRELAEILTSRGIPSDAWVVIYGGGSGGFGDEGRLYWTLAYLGHKKLSVLDGGVPAWKKAGFELTTEGPDRPHKKFRAKPLPALRIDKAALVAAMAAKKVKVLDVRDRDEYEGAKKFGEPRGGHIPEAIHLPWKKLFAADGTLLPPEELKKVLEAHQVSTTDSLVVYCTGGVRSGFAFLALKAAGVQKVANYDGSFWEWAADPALPVATK